MVLTVLVEDVNDHPPIFMNLPVTIEVNELSSINEPLFILISSDVDINENGRVYYYVENVSTKLKR